MRRYGRARVGPGPRPREPAALPALQRGAADSRRAVQAATTPTECIGWRAQRLGAASRQLERAATRRTAQRKPPTGLPRR
eukprot:5101914-Pleurochrysis_carterae.AAC.1